MSETIINGIDVSEEIRYCNNCSNLGLDFKAHKFYCSLSNRPDELPEVLSCDEFNTNCYIKRLQEENEELKDKYSKMTHKYNDLYEKYRAKEILEPDLKNEIKKFDALSIKYGQALEEIRDYANTLYNEPLMDGSKLRLRSGMYRIKSKINEVLNDRD